MNDDMELVRDYISRHSEPAFATLVSRYINLVYATAFRQVRDPHLAEEITQATFIIFARKAHTLGPRTILASWLHRTAVFAATDALKSQRRRLQREQKAHMQSEIHPATPDPVWEAIAPLLDRALVQLGEKDRQAVVLHFFEKKNFASVGVALGVSEDTARKRTSRALEKLRKFFARHGVPSSTAVIAGVMAANSAHAAPAVLVKATTTAAMAHGTVSLSTLAFVKGTLKLMAWTKAKTALVTGTVVLLAVGTTSIFVTHELKVKRQEKQLEEISATKKYDAGVWASGMELYARQHHGQYPASLDQLDYSTNLSPGSVFVPGPNRSVIVFKMGDGRTLPYAVTGTNDFEIVLSDAHSRVINPGSTIVLRERQTWRTPEGRWARTYAFADGHREVHVQSDQDFDPWEKRHMNP